MTKHIDDRPRAVLVGVHLPEVTDLEHATHLAELRRLVHTLGYETVATISQRRARPGAGTVLGTGKLKELANLTGGPGVIASGAADRTSKAKERWEAEAAENEDSADEEAADEEAADAEPQVVVGEKPTVVVVDHELSPSQVRNLEKRDRRAGARSHRRHRRHLPPPRPQPRGAHAGRDRAAEVRRAAAAGVGGPVGAPAGAGCGQLRARARSPQDPRPASPSCTRGWPRSSGIRTTAASLAGISCAWRWSATPTPASRR